MTRKLFPFVLFFFAFSCQNMSGGGGQKESDGASLSSSLNQPVVVTTEDSLVHTRLVEKANEEQFEQMPLSEVIVQVAGQFYGQPYVAHTLETDGEEQLVVNLREFDCTTYVENVLALSFCFKSGQTDFTDYLEMLRKLRYRDGIIDQYPSRLHYFSEWLADNQKKGLVKIVSNDLGDKKFDARVDFMTENRDRYDQLAENDVFVNEMAQAEDRISEYDLKYISANRLEEVSPKIKSGDIIAFCSSIDGLDVTHTGFAVHTDDGLYFAHASLGGEKVMLSDVRLKTYIENRDNVYGILVGRPQLSFLKDDMKGQK